MEETRERAREKAIEHFMPLFEILSGAVGVESDILVTDFLAFNQAIDEAIDHGLSEEEATEYVASIWGYPTEEEE